MKVAILQLNFIVGDLIGNTEKIISGYLQACLRGADLVVSTELSLFGYPPRDLLFLKNYQAEQARCLEKIIGVVGDVGLIVGVAEENHDFGNPFFNSAYLLVNHAIVHRQRKSLLPNYDVFDERRYFEEFLENQLIPMYRGKKLAMLICEDIWGGQEVINGHKRYQFDPLRQLKAAHPDLLVVTNASPYYWGKGWVRFELVSNLAKQIDCPVVYANQVGGNDELIFDGRSFVVDQNGECQGAAEAFQEVTLIVETSLSPINQDLLRQTRLDDREKVEDLYQALVLGTRDYLNKVGIRNGVVLGLSGGIDSAVTACIACEATSSRKVVGISMPSTFSSQGSIDDAQDLATNLGIVLDTDFIGEIYQAYADCLVSKIKWLMPGENPKDVTEENIQARIRGNLLMAYSNRSGRIVLTTGNKSELAVGYCTLYGDMAGGLAVISDVPKTVVYRLAQYINRDKVVIPLNTITKPPSAELRPDQRDTDSLPPYDILDEVLRLYIEDQLSPDDIVAKQITDQATVHRVLKMVNGNEFKRRQSAPGLRVTTKAFGVGRRFPIAAKFIS